MHKEAKQASDKSFFNRAINEVCSECRVAGATVMILTPLFGCSSARALPSCRTAQRPLEMQIIYKQTFI